MAQFVHATAIAADKFAAFHVVDGTMCIGETKSGTFLLVDIEDAAEFGEVFDITGRAVKFADKVPAGDRLSRAAASFNVTIAA